MAANRLSVCPHDTAKNVTGWFILNTYLQRHLECAIHFEPKDNFIEERASILAGGYQIVYANPFSAAQFRKSLGFIPVARPIDVFDETVLVSGLNKGIPTHRPIRVASATDKLIVHPLGLSLLEKQNIALSDCEFGFAGTHLKVAQFIMDDKADLGFIYNETWNGLSETRRQSMTIIDQSVSKQAFHCFCVSPEWLDKVAPLQAVLCNMQNDPQGKRILQDINSPGFQAMAANDLDALVESLDKLKILD